MPRRTARSTTGWNIRLTEAGHVRLPGRSTPTSAATVSRVMAGSLCCDQNSRNKASTTSAPALPDQWRDLCAAVFSRYECGPVWSAWACRSSACPPCSSSVLRPRVGSNRRADRDRARTTGTRLPRQGSQGSAESELNTAHLVVIAHDHVFVSPEPGRCGTRGVSNRGDKHCRGSSTTRPVARRSDVFRLPGNRIQPLVDRGARCGCFDKAGTSSGMRGCSSRPEA